MTNEIFISTTTQRILAYLAIHSAEEFTEKEISRRTGVKKSATNLALRNLVRTDLISRRKIGRSSLFKADISENLIREIKVLITKEKLSPLVKKLKKTSKKIALFGSAAAGTNTKDSDIDLFVLTNNPKNVRNIIDDSSLAEKIQLICKTPTEMVKINKKKPLIFSEIEKGQVLWEKNE